MQETFALLQTYVLGIWRYRWLAVSAAWVLAIAGWALVFRMPESYVASARVFADTSSVLGPLMRGLTVTPNPNERLAMMSRTLLSRPNLQRLAQMTDLDLEATTAAEQEALIENLLNAITLSGARGNNSLYSISATHPDRDVARRLTQAVITIFIETSMENQSASSSDAQSFIEQQIAESEQRLVESEKRLAEFKRNNVDMLPGETGDYYNRLIQARRELQATRLQLRELENRQAELNRQVEGETPIFIAGGRESPTDSALDVRIQSLKVHMDGLLTRYTERHPEVQRTERLIANLEAERQREMENASNSTGSSFSGLSDNPIYQGMRSLLAEARANAAALEVRVAEYEQRVRELEAQVYQIPEVEAQLAQLNRDYSVLYSQHQELLQRRESARLSEDVQRNAGEVTFRVIDPPFVPRQPSQPNKLLLNAGVLIVALGSGGALALLITLLHPIVTHPRMLTQATGLPLLGSVTYKKSQAETRRDRLELLAFVMCGVGLVVAFGALTAMPLLIS